MGLCVESPSQDTYNELKAWFVDVANELEFKNAYDPVKVIGANTQVNYLFKRCLIESVAYGQDAFISEGMLAKEEINMDGTVRTSIGNSIYYEGWRHF